MAERIGRSPVIQWLTQTVAAFNATVISQAKNINRKSRTMNKDKFVSLLMRFHKITRNIGVQKNTRKNSKPVYNKNLKIIWTTKILWLIYIFCFSKSFGLLFHKFQINFFVQFTKWLAMKRKFLFFSKLNSETNLIQGVQKLYS